MRKISHSVKSTLIALQISAFGALSCLANENKNHLTIDLTKMTMNDVSISELIVVDLREGKQGFQKRFATTVKAMSEMIGEPDIKEEKSENASWKANFSWPGGVTLSCSYWEREGKPMGGFKFRCSGAALTHPIKGKEYISTIPVLNEETKKESFLEELRKGTTIEMHSEAFDNATWIKGKNSVSVVFPTNAMHASITIGAM